MARTGWASSVASTSTGAKTMFIATRVGVRTVKGGEGQIVFSGSSNIIVSSSNNYTTPENSLDGNNSTYAVSPFPLSSSPAGQFGAFQIPLASLPSGSIITGMRFEWFGSSIPSVSGSQQIAVAIAKPSLSSRTLTGLSFGSASWGGPTDDLSFTEAQRTIDDPAASYVRMTLAAIRTTVGGADRYHNINNLSGYINFEF